MTTEIDYISIDNNSAIIKKKQLMQSRCSIYICVGKTGQIVGVSDIHSDIFKMGHTLCVLSFIQQGRGAKKRNINCQKRQSYFLV